MERDDVVLVMENQEGLYFPKWYDTWGHFLDSTFISACGFGDQYLEETVREMEENLDAGREAECYGDRASISYYVLKVTKDDPNRDNWYPAGYVSFDEIEDYGEMDEHRDNVDAVLQDLLGISLEEYVRLKHSEEEEDVKRYEELEEEYDNLRDGDTFDFIDVSYWRELPDPDSELGMKLIELGVNLDDKVLG